MLQNNLIMLRNTAGFSQEDVAEQVGISRQAYAKWEKGSSIPDIEKCAKLANLYGVSIDSLLNFDTHIEGIKTAIAPAPKGKHIFGTVTLNDKGQIVIPKIARDIMGLETGTRLIVLGDETEGIALVKADIFERNMQKTMELANKHF